MSETRRTRNRGRPKDDARAPDPDAVLRGRALLDGQRRGAEIDALRAAREEARRDLTAAMLSPWASLPALLPGERGLVTGLQMDARNVVLASRRIRQVEALAGRHHHNVHGAMGAHARLRAHAMDLRLCRIWSAAEMVAAAPTLYPWFVSLVSCETGRPEQGVRDALDAMVYRAAHSSPIDVTAELCATSTKHVSRATAEMRASFDLGRSRGRQMRDQMRKMFAR